MVLPFVGRLWQILARSQSPVNTWGTLLGRLAIPPLSRQPRNRSLAPAAQKIFVSSR